MQFLCVYYCECLYIYLCWNKWFVCVLFIPWLDSFLIPIYMHIYIPHIIHIYRVWTPISTSDVMLLCTNFIFSFWAYEPLVTQGQNTVCWHLVNSWKMVYHINIFCSFDKGIWNIKKIISIIETNINSCYSHNITWLICKFIWSCRPVCTVFICPWICPRNGLKTYMLGVTHLVSCIEPIHFKILYYNSVGQ